MAGIRYRTAWGKRSTSIYYDGEYGSERVLIVSGRATVVPDDGSPSFTVGTGDAVYFMYGFRCTWRILESPLVHRYGYFGADGKEIKNDGSGPAIGLPSISCAHG